LPAADAPNALLKVSTAPPDPGASAADILTITPAGMAALFLPAAMHVYAPARKTHDTSFSEVSNAGSAAALSEPIAEAGYCSVHCNALAPEPCGDHVTSNVIAPFEVGTPEESANTPPPCAKTIAGIDTTKPRTSFIAPRNPE
jgi:hypothetical protein